MINTKLKNKEEIVNYNRELINNLESIDCSWFQNKGINYDCCNTLAFLFTEGHLSGINECEDLKITVPRYKIGFKEMCEKGRDTKEKEWERICDNLQLFAFFNSDGKHLPELLHVIKLLGFVIYINYQKELDQFRETYQDGDCKELIEDLLNNGQIQFTSEGIVYCCEDNFARFNKVLLESVIKATDAQNIKMDVF